MNPEQYLRQDTGLGEYIKMVKMDDRNLTQILDQATTHYIKVRDLFIFQECLH